MQAVKYLLRPEEVKIVKTVTSTLTTGLCPLLYVNTEGEETER
jgi:hypothetical protein